MRKTTLSSSNLRFSPAAVVFYRPPGSIPGDGLLGSALSPRPPHGHGPTPRPKAAAMAAQPAELLLVQVSSSHRFQACFAPACEARPRGCGRAAAAWGLPQDSTGSRWRMPLAGWPAFSSEHLLCHVPFRPKTKEDVFSIPMFQEFCRLIRC